MTEQNKNSQLRLPSASEYEKLIEKCYKRFDEDEHSITFYDMTTNDSVKFFRNGYKIRENIFDFHKLGLYCSSTPHEFKTLVHNLYFEKENAMVDSSMNHYSMKVRLVSEQPFEGSAHVAGLYWKTADEDGYYTVQEARETFGQKSNDTYKRRAKQEFLKVEKVYVEDMNIEEAEKAGYATSTEGNTCGVEVTEKGRGKYWMPLTEFKKDSFPVLNETLCDSVRLMLSEDYKERFKAEHMQLQERYLRLADMLSKWENGNLSFTPNCPMELYNIQLKAMKEYLDTLVIRARIENIDLYFKNRP